MKLESINGLFSYVGLVMVVSVGGPETPTRINVITIRSYRKRMEQNVAGKKSFWAAMP